MTDEQKAYSPEGSGGTTDEHKTAMEEFKARQERFDRDVKRAHDEADPFYQTPEAEKLRATIQRIKTGLEEVKKVRERVYSEQMKLGNPLVKEHVEAVREIRDYYDKLFRSNDENKELIPYIMEELRNPEWDDYRFLDFTLKELLDAAEQDTERTGPAVIVERARQAMESHRREEQLPVLFGRRNPKNYVSPISLLSKEITKGIIGKDEAVDFPVLNIGMPSEVTITVRSEIDDRFTGYGPFDRAVHNAVISFFVDCENKRIPPIITAEMIYRFLLQKESEDSLSNQMLSRITESIESQRHIFVAIDATDEFKARYGEAKIDGQKVKDFKFDGYWIQATARRVTLKNGHVKNAYYIDEPIDYGYAKAVNNNIITAPASMLNIKNVKKTATGEARILPTSVTLTETRIIIRDILLHRVRLITRDQKDAEGKLKKYESKRRKNISSGKNASPKRDASFFRHPKISDTILIDPILAEAGLSNNRKDRNDRSRATSFIFKVLDYWTASGDIPGYLVRKKGQAEAVPGYLIDKKGWPVEAVIITHCP